jgi:acetyltransferase
VLADGRPVLVRPMHPDDAPHVARFITHLSPEARRNRFQLASSHDPQALARFHAQVDYAGHMAFVCTARENGRELIVGDARYFANPDRKSCEFGIVVADGWRHTGVAQHLMRSLTADAKDKGFRTMGSLVLRGNRDLLDFAVALGFAVEDLPRERERVRITRML